MNNINQALRYQADIFGDNYFYLIPATEREDGVIEGNWAKYPQGALVRASVKHQRIQELHQKLGRNINLSMLVRTIARNPMPIAQPTEVFLRDYNVIARGFAAIGHPHPQTAWISNGFRHPGLLSCSATQILEPIFKAAECLNVAGYPADTLVRAMEANKDLLPVMVAIGNAGISELQTHMQYDTPSSRRAAQILSGKGLKLDWDSFLSAPSEVCHVAIPHHDTIKLPVGYKQKTILQVSDNYGVVDVLAPFFERHRIFRPTVEQLCEANQVVLNQSPEIVVDGLKALFQGLSQIGVRRLSGVASSMEAAPSLLSKQASDWVDCCNVLAPHIASRAVFIPTKHAANMPTVEVATGLSDYMRIPPKELQLRLDATLAAGVRTIRPTNLHSRSAVLSLL